MSRKIAFHACAALLACFAFAMKQAVAADIVIENPRVRIALGDDATWVSLVDKQTGKDWIYKDRKVPLAEGRFADKADSAASASWDGKQLKVKFAKTDTELTYEVRCEPDWIVVTLMSVSGARPTHLTLLRAPVAITETVGARLNIARNKDLAVCLISANLQSQGSGALKDKGKWADLQVLTQDAPGPKLEGAAAALILSPMSEIRRVLCKASLAFGLPTNMRDGVPVKELREVKGSYWFLAFGEQDVDKVIDCCKRSGFRQVMLSFGAWSTAAGHYPINERNYPKGKESLKAMVDRLHAEGILVGMHTFASKVKKTDPYVTPIPDKRFWKDMQITLAEDATADQTTLRANESLDQWPGSPVCKQKSWEGGVTLHQEVILGDEIISYKSIGPEGRYDTFLDCRRGAWKTSPAAHKAGTPGYHFGVDGCINGYIIDEETDLIDEVTSNLADVFNYCGFDMVYFDGGEDVDRRRFDYYVTKNQALAMSKFKKRPILHMGTIMTHNLWHSFARSGTVDTYMATMRGHMISLGEVTNLRRVIEDVNGVPKRTLAFEIAGKQGTWFTVKDHIDKSVKYAVRMEEALMPAELGWFGIWPKNQYSDGLQLDEAEYLMAKSLAYDLPISLETGFREMEAHPLTPQILEIVRVYEEIRMAQTADEATRAKLRELGKDFLLVQRDGRREFVGARELPKVAGTENVRSLVGQLPDGVAVASVWHYIKDGKLTLSVDPAKLRAASFLGEPIEVTKGDGKVVIPVDSRRTTLFFEGMSAVQAGEIMANGAFEERPPVKIWVQAEAFTSSQGKMAKGSATGVTEPEALGDVIVCTDRPDPAQPQEWYCEYAVDIPRKATWTLWGRVRYPSGTDQSFWFVPQGTNEKAAAKRVLGNCGVNQAKWHWTGSGGGSSAVPPGAPIVLDLSQGPFTFRVYAREGSGTPEQNPRLDVLCICDDPDYAPTDEDARAALK